MPPAVGLVAAAAGTIVAGSFSSVLIGSLVGTVVSTAIPHVPGAGIFLPHRKDLACRS